MLSLELLPFGFSLQETLTLLTMVVKAIHCKTENDIRNERRNGFHKI